MSIKIRKTNDDSLGAVLMDGGKCLKIWEEKGKRIVELVDEATYDILDIMPEVEKVWNKIKDLFENIWNGRFPCIIRIGGLDYVYTEQPAPWKGIDKVMYLCLSDDKTYNSHDVIFVHESPNLLEAKNALYREIKAAGYVK
jgi:hypothetical protein